MDRKCIEDFERRKKQKSKKKRHSALEDEVEM